MKNNKIKTRNREYNLSHKEEIRARKRAYYLANKDKIYAYQKTRRKISLANNMKRRDKVINSWSGLIPEKTNCPICGKEIFFNVKNYTIAIHFDHRNEGNEKIKSHPSMFLYTKYRTEETEKIWNECDFGMLCRRCNLLLPTKNRKEYVRKVVEYVYGQSYEIKEKA